MPHFSRSSLHARFYDLMYGNYFPPNLCPYFWKCMLGLVLFIPLIIYHLPTTLLRWVVSLFDTEDTEAFKLRVEGWLCKEDLLMGLFVNVVVWLVSSMILVWFMSHIEFIKCGAIVGYFLSIILIIAGIVNGIKYLIQKNMKKKIIDSTYQEKKKQPNLVVEFVKAKYNKHCPKINWED